MTTRLNQSLYVNGNIDLIGNITVPGNIYLGGYITEPPNTDSISKCDATFTQITNNRSNRLENVEFIESFKDNQWIRIYGAMTDTENYNIDLIQTVNTTILLNSPPTDLDSDLTQTQFSYRLAEFNMTTGAISPASQVYSINVRFPISQFSSDRFIRFTFTTLPQAGHGLLIYRRIGIVGQFKLAYVLGPKDFSQTFIDYYTFDYTPWGQKNPIDNTYYETIHFPQTPPISPMLGWCDEQIDFVDVGSNSIVLKNSVRVSSLNPHVNISHNDTYDLQKLIDDQEEIGRKNLKIHDKIYIVSSLELPSVFSISGIPRFSTLKKLPWTNINNIIKTKNNTNATKITLDGIDIDGDVYNQYLLNDSSDKSVNHAVNFGSNSEDCVVNNTKIYNVIGGGLFSPSSNRLKINVSEIFNSGLTDRYSYNPIFAEESNDIIISACRFQNFTDNLDLSLSYKGVITNNIIENCGSGLFIFGSRFFISSPNVLMGPAGEYLPLPDILNSEYNSININLITDSPTPSPVFTYQENGNLFNLVSDPRNNIIYQIWKLEKTQLGQENLYEEILDVNIQNVFGLDNTLGQFAFIIPRESVIKLQTAYRFNNLIQTNQHHRGIVYTASLQEWVNAGNIVPIGSGENAISGSVNGDEYTLNVQNIKYLYVGAQVEIQNHSGFDLIGSGSIGEVTNISSFGQISTVTIKFQGATIVAGNDPLNTGYINIINKFLLAKGKII